jgi:hypothetical protein
VLLRGRRWKPLRELPPHRRLPAVLLGEIPWERPELDCEVGLQWFSTSEAYDSPYQGNSMLLRAKSLRASES